MQPDAGRRPRAVTELIRTVPPTLRKVKAAMARRGPTRLELRRQAEAVESQGGAEAPAKAKKSRKSVEPGDKPEKVKKSASKAKKPKERPTLRKRLVWVVYSPSMKEEGRFAYDQRPAAEERLEALKLKHKKPYFIQGVKETLSETGAVIPKEKTPAEPKERPARRRAEKRDDEEDDDDRDAPMGDDDDE